MKLHTHPRLKPGAVKTRQKNGASVPSVRGKCKIHHLNLISAVILFVCAPYALFGDEIIADAMKGQSGIVKDINVKDNKQEETSLNTIEELTKETVHNDSLLNAEIPDLHHSHSHTKLTVIRREHDYKRQVWMAIAMMTFVAIILGTSQSWNPS